MLVSVHSISLSSHIRGCVIPKQIEKIKALAEDDPEKVPGYQDLSTEFQKQVRLAFEAGKVVDKEFKGTRTDLIKKGGGNSGSDEIRYVMGFKVEVATRAAAMCRNAACKGTGIKIQKVELRLGIATMWDGEHETWAYKHW